MAEMLYGLKVIAARFGTRKFRVKEWHKAGAPILLLNTDRGLRYRADYDKLYGWLVNESKISQGERE